MSQRPPTEIASVSTVGPGGKTVRIKRQGQAIETRFLPVATGVTGLAVGSRVVLTRLGGDLNTAFISAKLT